MANLINTKVAEAACRVKVVKEILVELEKSNSSFKSARKLSEYIAKKMNEQGDQIDSSTLRRKGSHYKELVDAYFGDKTSKGNAASTMSKDLKIRKQKQQISELETLLSEATKDVKDKETEIQMLLVDLHTQQKQGLALIAPPKASIYSKSELNELKTKYDKNAKQLKKAITVIDKLISDADGTYEVRDNSVIDLVSDQPLFTENHIPDYFTKKDNC